MVTNMVRDCNAKHMWCMLCAVSYPESHNATAPPRQVRSHMYATHAITLVHNIHNAHRLVRRLELAMHHTKHPIIRVCNCESCDHARCRLYYSDLTRMCTHRCQYTQCGVLSVSSWHVCRDTTRRARTCGPRVAITDNHPTHDGSRMLRS